MSKQHSHYLPPNKESNYVSFQKFAPTLSKKLNTQPVSSSIVSDIDQALDMGPLYQWYGPQSESSQLYMADKCAKNWDGSCEFLSMNNDMAKNNLGVISNSFRAYPQSTSSVFTVGDMLVSNTAQRKFCDLSQCKIYQQHYNPLDPTSPMVNSYQCGTDVVARLPPPNICDKDPVLNKMLDRPQMHSDLFLNMYRNCKNRGQYKGTRIGKIFEVIDAYIILNQNRVC